MDKRAQARERKARQLDRERRGVIVVNVEVDQSAIEALAEYEPEITFLEGKVLRDAVGETLTAWVENLGLRHENTEETDEATN